MPYELTSLEWSIIRPVLPAKSRGVPRVDDRCVLNGIFWVLRLGASWSGCSIASSIAGCGRMAARDDKLLAFIKIAAIQFWLGVYEATSWGPDPRSRRKTETVPRRDWLRPMACHPRRCMIPEALSVDT